MIFAKKSKFDDAGGPDTVVSPKDLSPKRINTETSNMGGHTTLVENGHEQLKQTSGAFISFRNICHQFVCCICIVQSQHKNVKLFKA